MTKYYCVRTPEQWDWTMKRIESDNRKARFYSPLVPPCRPTKLEMHPEVFKKDVLVGVNGNKVEWDTFNYFVKEENVTEFIEVSDLMEGEKMENYVTINIKDFDKIKDEDGQEAEILESKILVPTSLLYPKIKMTKAKKKEFDKLKDEMSLDRHDLDDLLTRIKDSEDFPLLYHRLYVADGDGVESQLEFACAWADPSLIEVVKEPKFNVKVPNTKDCLYYKINNSVRAGVPQRHPSRFKFTVSELKQYGLDSDMYEKVEVQE